MTSELFADREFAFEITMVLPTGGQRRCKGDLTIVPGGALEGRILATVWGDVPIRGHHRNDTLQFFGEGSVHVPLQFSLHRTSARTFTGGYGTHAGSKPADLILNYDL